MISCKSILFVLACPVLLAACGSKPVAQPPAVTSTRDAMSMGMRAYTDNRYLEARGYFEKALVQYRSIDNFEGQLYALVDLADSALGQGEYVAARSYLASAQRILADRNFSLIAAHVNLLQAYADLQAGDDARAVKRLAALITASGTPGNIMRSALFARTQAAFDLKAADADHWLARLNTALSGGVDALSTARYQRLQALAARRHGDFKQATELYQKALQGYRNRYYRPGIAATLEEWADMSLQQERWPDAQDRMHRALDIRLWMYDRTHSEKDLKKLAQAEAQLGDAKKSEQYLRLAAYLKNGGSPDLLTKQQ